MSLQPAVQQMLDNLWQTALTNPNSAFYLPTLITKAGFAPSYSAGSWPVGTITGAGGTQIAQNLCMDTAAFGQNSIPPPGALPDLELSEIVIHNLSAVTMPSAPVSSGPDGLTITAVIVFNNIQIAGNFVLTQQCCLTADLKTCEPNTTLPQVGKGTFTLTLGGNSTATAVAVISALAPNTLTITTNSIAYVVDYTQMTASVDITNIPDSEHRAKWNAQAEKAFNYQPAQEVMVAAMNTDLGGDGPKKQIGEQLTSDIDSYLQSTHHTPTTARSEASSRESWFTSAVARRPTAVGAPGLSGRWPGADLVCGFDDCHGTPQPVAAGGHQPVVAAGPRSPQLPGGGVSRLGHGLAVVRGYRHAVSGRRSLIGCLPWLIRTRGRSWAGCASHSRVGRCARRSCRRTRTASPMRSRSAGRPTRWSRWTPPVPPACSSIAACSSGWAQPIPARTAGSRTRFTTASISATTSCSASG